LAAEPYSSSVRSPAGASSGGRGAKRSQGPRRCGPAPSGPPSGGGGDTARWGVGAVRPV